MAEDAGYLRINWEKIDRDIRAVGRDLAGKAPCPRPTPHDYTGVSGLTPVWCRARPVEQHAGPRGAADALGQADARGECGHGRGVRRWIRLWLQGRLGQGAGNSFWEERFHVHSASPKRGVSVVRSSHRRVLPIEQGVTQWD